jgi:hypothetical protein
MTSTLLKLPKKKERKKERKSAEDGCTTAFHKEIKIYDS